jgi:hypothetical protein
MRERLGYEVQGIGETPLGKGWENMADLSIKPTIAGNITDEYLTETNPWLLKVPPETKVYQIDNDQFADLGFGHMRDELRNALDPESDLPDALKITPDKLKMLNMAQASKLVDDINAFRATRATEVNAARAANIATVPVKEYPEQGLKWVELKMPDDLPEGYEPGKPTALGEPTYRQPGTKNDMLEDPRKAALKDALKYEGEMLKHCVGGYCEDVVQGRSRIFSLRDDDGRPRVTIEVRAPKNRMTPGEFYQSDKAPESLLNRLTAIENSNPSGLESNWEQIIADSPEYKAYAASTPMIIKQVKGVDNRKPQPEDIPLVQDFIRSGNYEIVGDINNTDLFDVENVPDIMPEAIRMNKTERKRALDRARKAGKVPKYLTREEYENLLREFGTPEEMAAGGKVGYNAAAVDTIVNRVREKFNG